MAPTAMLTGFGVTAMDESLGTFNVALPLTPLSEAVMAVVPEATAVARPAALTVATAGLAAVQAALAVMFCVVPSLYVAVAENCCVAPTKRFAGFGETEIEESTGVTVSVAVPVTPFSDAVTAAEPAATAVARPDAFTVATAGLAVVHAALPVTSAVEPSL